MKVHIKVDGMSCGGCVNAVRKVLEAVPSVASATVDLASGHAIAEVSFDFDPQVLVSAIEDAGYDASIMASTE